MTAIDLLAATTPPSTTSDPTTWVIVGAAALFLVYAMQRMSKRQSKREPENSFFTPRGGLAREREAEQQMEHVLVEFSKMTRELNAQLDTRAAKLEALIGDADERIARLEVLLTQAPPRPSFDRTAGDAPLKLVHPPAEPSEPVRVTDDMAPSPSIDAGHAEVYRLADEGRNVQQIAGQLSRPSGEVELILALRPRG